MYPLYELTEPSQKGGFLDVDAVTRKEEMRETSVVCGGEGGEILEGGGEA